MAKVSNKDGNLYIALVSVHGLFRAEQAELGRDSDTGGQIKYVLELARTLGEHPQVERVDLLTRQVFDNKVDDIYAQPEESITDNVKIVRIACGPRRYLRKEVLWPHLDSFIDNSLIYFRSQRTAPDIIHSHYADAGYIGARLTQFLAIPFIFTGHSLGRVKRERLLAHGAKPESIEKQYAISQRIEAEEIALGNANLVIASTKQEIDEQYAQYENYHPRRMLVVPPGINLDRFHPPTRTEPQSQLQRDVDRFLQHPRKPMILALSRPDRRKNISTLIEAYAGDAKLREIANLVIVAGNRDDIMQMEKGSREVLINVLYLIDKHDLYGKVAYPKTHNPDDVPALYRLATKRKGVFVNPALTEPFGLTLIEAAASGLPIVATHDGGPNDIIGHCKNGLLIDPLDATQMAETLHQCLDNKSNWKKWSKNGIAGTRKFYSWKGHVDLYLKAISRLNRQRRATDIPLKPKSRLPAVQRLLICDIDNTLIGDQKALDELIEKVQSSKHHIGFGVATGRHLESALQIIVDYEIPLPDVLITSVGTEIFYGHQLVLDHGFERHINYRWDNNAFKEAMVNIPGIKLQPKINQGKFKVSYFTDAKAMPKLTEIKKHFRKLDLHAKLVHSQNAYLDIVPIRASKGMAIRYLAMKWGIPAENILVAGDSGNDEEMLGGNMLAVVVGNYSRELQKLKGKPHVFFAPGHYARGILEGAQYYDFFGDISPHDDE